MKKFFNFFLFLVFVTAFSQGVFAQAGTYYDALNVSSTSFVTDLKARIRSPYTKISYDQFDETNIANFAAINNGNGTKSVFCVYSNYEFIYSGTFSWGTMSREHTWCHSWMPTYDSESGNEYSDQHHLFPTHQNNANGRRSNHPLGIVTSPTYTFMEGKLGKNSLNQTVYEPRDAQKGDAARALLYMSVKYDDVNNNNWTFNWLNNTRLPSVSEAPQPVELLLQWHKQDPPRKREVERNNYIQSVQKNRNPFSDHPEYVNYIDFNTLTKLNPVYAAEPTNHVTNLQTSSNGYSINLTWNQVAGTQAPSGYLIIAYDKDDYFLPIDGEVYTNDTNLGDGSAVVNTNSTTSYTFENLVNLEEYYFTVIPFNGEGTQINYKINGTLPRAINIQAVPVELTSFSANINENLVTVNWITASEKNNSGFEVERRSFNDVNNWDNLGFVEGSGTTTETNSYSFNDKLSTPGKYCYRIKQLDFDGAFNYSNEVVVEYVSPNSFRLNQNYPNPFNPSTKISFQLADDSQVSIKVYNVLGQLVSTLLDENLAAGSYEREFNAANFNSGVYFYKMETENFSDVKKMILAK